MAAGEDSKRLAIGIDLGTTNCCVAAWKHDKIEIFVNNQGNRTTPSCVAFTEDEQLVGDAAFEGCRFNPANTIFGVKRLMGRSYTDPLVQKQIKLWPFKVVPSEDGRPKVVVKHGGEEKRFFAEEISSMILAYMKATAEEKLGTIVKDAVITVPANFSDAQRRATKNAGEAAGLNVLRILNEPTAAAIAYDLDEASWGDGPRNVLVFDFGGGTLDVSIFRMEGEGLHLSVKATGGDTHLGGEDIDERMMQFLMTELKKKHGLDVNEKPKYLRLMRTECERAKKVLSFSDQTMIRLEFSQEGIEFQYRFTRSKFEHLNNELFGRCMQIVEKCLVDAKMHKGDIDDVVLAGGSTRIPKVQQLLEELFGGEKLRKTINPDEAIAYGAAVYATKQVGMGSEKVQDLVIVDVTPLSLGVRAMGGKMEVMIPRNTPFPVVVQAIMKNANDNQTEFCIGVYEGERPFCTRKLGNIVIGPLTLPVYEGAGPGVSVSNHLLVEFTFGPLPPARAGETEIVLGMAVDADGILLVWAEHEESGLTKLVHITNLHETLSPEEIESNVKKADEYKLEDTKHLEKSWNMAGLESLIRNGRSRIQDAQTKLTTECRKTLEEEVDKAAEWLKQNRRVEASEILKQWEQLEEKLNGYIDLKGLTIEENFKHR